MTHINILNKFITGMLERGEFVSDNVIVAIVRLTIYINKLEHERNTNVK